MLQRTTNSQRSETNYYPTQGTVSIQDDSQQISVSLDCQKSLTVAIRSLEKCQWDLQAIRVEVSS